MSTGFEQFPNELILNVFEYFNPQNLYCSFWGINQRLNNLLQALNNLALRIDRDNPVLIQQLATQITRLQVDTSQAIDLSPLINLQSLELCRASDIQLKQVQPDNMPKLSTLIISTHFYIGLPLEFVQKVFSDAFRVLRRVSLTRLDMFQLPTGFQSSSLHSISITSTDPNVIPQILCTCPTLSSFQVTFFGLTRPNLPSSSKSYDHSLERFSLTDPFHLLSFDTIQILLLYVPNVKYLSLQFLCGVPFINLIKTMVKQLEHLDKFECDIFELPNDQMVDVEVIQQTNECFRYLQCVSQDDGSRQFLTE